MEIEYIVIALLGINIILIIYLITRVMRPSQSDEKVTEIKTSISSIESKLKDEFKSNRDEASQNAKDGRKELAESFEKFEKKFERNVDRLNDTQKEKFDELKEEQEKLVQATEKQLDKVRETVDEKLDKTLNERLTKSFQQVGDRLESVQKGLGKMQTLAEDVGGLKKVLSNVKMRGGIGEVQLEMMLENILAPDQYEANVKTKPNSSEVVEFAVKLPGRDDKIESVWLPIDAKFPRDIYEQLQDSYDEGDPDKILSAQKNLERTIKNMAKDISQKYLNPPYTTDFGIMFLPFEGIYSEVVRNASLLEEVRNTHQVIITGPTTLAAILNSLQMGFKTLAIQKHSSEIREVLGAVKTEFGKFGGMLGKAQKNFQTGMNQLDDVLGKRTRAIDRKLRNIESLSDQDSNKILPGIGEEILDED